MEYLTRFGFTGMFASSFLAATILPLSSEITLGALILSGLNPVALVMVATIGNVLGSIINYGMGYGGAAIFRKRFATASDQEVNASLARFEKYGVVSLLFAWAPIIGDPLTVAAGVLRINLAVFLLLVTLGKFARYAILTWLILQT